MQFLLLGALTLLGVAHALPHEQAVASRLGVRSTTAALTPDEAILVNSINNAAIEDWSSYYAHGAHLAGTNRSQAQWTADRWASNGFDSRLVSYDVYLSYPVSKSLTLTLPGGSVYTPSLAEDVLQADDTTSYPNRIPTFNGYSASGSVEAEYVYVGYCSADEFETADKLGVPLEGKIAVCRYGGPFRGLKVKLSQQYGCIGTLLFTDPGDDGLMTIQNGYKAYPEGPARNPSSVQRGSVMFLSSVQGDPTTPGYPSHEGSPRADTSEVLPHIPSIPLSSRDIEPILQALDGYGTVGKQVHSSDWVGALNATYSTGPAPGAVLSMSNEMESKITPIWDAIGIINGTNEDEVILLGNHRDAWIVGGAADPNSGSAVLVELSKAMGKLAESGWKPKRTIVFASWDCEEYASIGSTEFVEEYETWLVSNSVTYINLDIAVSGMTPYFEGTPDLYDLAAELMKKVSWRGMSNHTLWDQWQTVGDAYKGPLGSGSDYVAFLHRGGTSSIDIGSVDGSSDPVYHYHSDYDSFHWMSTYGDPSFLTHKTIAQYVALLVYHLSSNDIVPLDPTTYAEELSSYYKDLQKTITSASATLDTSTLESAIASFKSSADDVMSLGAQAMDTEDEALVTVVNHKLRDYQKGFISQGGLPDRPFFQHVIMAPGINLGYESTTYPGITEAVEAGNLTLAAEWVEKTAAGIMVAANILKT